ncbi:hypothetical protein [Streptomyces sp. NPDC088755]|uniref:hypothetical protein n=1 Tax=Streptomyces sp. NPDC088755 TaxID=3365888 RepID=UPI0038132654
MSATALVGRSPRRTAASRLDVMRKSRVRPSACSTSAWLIQPVARGAGRSIPPSHHSNAPPVNR